MVVSSVSSEEEFSIIVTAATRFHDTNIKIQYEHTAPTSTNTSPSPALPIFQPCLHVFLSDVCMRTPLNGGTAVFNHPKEMTEISHCKSLLIGLEEATMKALYL
jgi:hypothetical protein